MTVKAAWIGRITGDPMISHASAPAFSRLFSTVPLFHYIFLLRVQKVVKENAFYCWHDTQSGQISEKIQEIQKTVISGEYTLFMEAFQLLNLSGSLKSEE